METLFYLNVLSLFCILFQFIAENFDFSRIRWRNQSFNPLFPKISALGGKVESLRAKQRESEKELENLFNVLMQRAFRGELVL